MVFEMNKLNDIDEKHFIELADAAKDAISKYGDFEWFIN